MREAPKGPCELPFVKAHHTYDDHSFGFVPHRRREEAQVIIQVAVWRFHQSITALSRAGARPKATAPGP